MWTDNESLRSKLITYKVGFQLWSQNSQSIETLCKAGSALEHAQMTIANYNTTGDKSITKGGPQAN